MLLKVNGTVPMKEGILSDDWAMSWPRASLTTQAKSLFSRINVEKEVRISVCAVSSMRVMSFPQITPNLTGLIFCCSVTLSLPIRLEQSLAVHGFQKA
jgi:hypothetical protein